MQVRQQMKVMKMRLLIVSYFGLFLLTNCTRTLQDEIDLEGYRICNAESLSDYFGELDSSRVNKLKTAILLSKQVHGPVKGYKKPIVLNRGSDSVVIWIFKKGRYISFKQKYFELTHKF